jgi:hypothetical protein
MAPVRRAALLGIPYLALLAYIWFDALSNGWAWGWAIVGTINLPWPRFSFSASLPSSDPLRYRSCPLGDARRRVEAPNRCESRSPASRARPSRDTPYGNAG